MNMNADNIVKIQSYIFIGDMYKFQKWWNLNSFKII